MQNITSLQEPTTLGWTGLKVGRLGLSASYGMPAAAVEMAFERGMNYLYWGSLRRGAFADALRHLKPQRERMVLVVQSYMRMGSLVEGSVERALKAIGYEYADVLLLGWWNGPVWSNVLAAARRLKERGLAHTERALAALEQGPMDVEDLAWMRRVGDAIYGKKR